MDILERLKMPKDYVKVDNTIDEFNRDIKVKQIKELEEYIKKEKLALVEHEQKNGKINNVYDLKITYLIFLGIVNIVATLLVCYIILQRL